MKTPPRSLHTIPVLNTGLATPKPPSTPLSSQSKNRDKQKATIPPATHILCSRPLSSPPPVAPDPFADSDFSDFFTLLHSHSTMSAALPSQAQLPPVTTVAPADETQPLATPPISTSELLALLQNMSRSAQQASLASQVPPASPLCFPAPTPVFNWLIFHASLGQCRLWCILSAFSVSGYQPLKPSYEFQGGIYVQAERAFSKDFPNFESFYYPLSCYFSILHAHVLSGNHSPVSTNFILGTSSYLALLCSWYLEYDWTALLNYHFAFHSKRTFGHSVLGPFITKLLFCTCLKYLGLEIDTITMEARCQVAQKSHQQLQS
ncbi:hypothetical protein BU17DRAFT_65996 [Hysterangium stoloniferum]|nr:hypothetical protein BU17DRAFT_65996 [Hysterangium stoloniferum]